MPATQSQVFSFAVRRTYGDHGRAEAALSIGSIEKATGRSRSVIKDALAELIAEGVLIEIRGPQVNDRGGLEARVVAVQTDFERWGKYSVPERLIPAFLRHDWEGGQSEQGGQGEQGTQDEQESAGRANTPGGAERTEQGGQAEHIKDKTSQTEQDSPYSPQEETLEGDVMDPDDDFAAFWAAYPRREARKRAESTWGRLSKAKRERALKIAEQMAELVAAGRAPAPQFIPLATTFLNGDRWDDWESGPPAGWGERADGGRGLSVAEVLGKTSRPAANSYQDAMTEEDLAFFTIPSGRRVGETYDEWEAREAREAAAEGFVAEDQES
jgi:hypothetical protein